MTVSRYEREAYICYDFNRLPHFEGGVVNGGLTCWTLSGLPTLNDFSGTEEVSLHYYCIFKKFS